MRHPDLTITSLFGDALSLGPHWIYNQGKIRRLYPDGIRTYDTPRSQYHPGKGAGDLTHYGDQVLILLESLAPGDWNRERWKNHWLAFWKAGPSSYQDGATSGTIENLEAGRDEPSDSNDLAGAARIAPLFALLDGDALIRAAKEQTALTHGDPQVIEAAGFFARATLAVLGGATFSEAFDEATGQTYEALPADEWLGTARQAAQGDLFANASRLGLTCHIPEAFPLTLALALACEDEPVGALSTNAMVGGDTSARGLLLGLLLGARHGLSSFPTQWLEDLNAHRRIESALAVLDRGGEPRTEKAVFPNPLGESLDAVIDFPAGSPRAFALFAHCFTCGKNLKAATRMARSLADKGIATLRFDFTGLGASGGDFAETSFLTNVGDLVAAADFLRDHHRAPAILIGHSLGGAAVLAAASRIPESKGVVTIGSPASPEHVTDLLNGNLDTIRRDGKAVVTLAGRQFTIGAKFLDDFAEHCQTCSITDLKRDLLVFHAPADEIVGIDNARLIFEAARHPKSFHSLAGADHLLTNPADSEHVAAVTAAWAERLLG